MNYSKIKKIFNVFIVVIFLLLLGCERKPEFYINGKGYYSVVRCAESHEEAKWGYHYGYSVMKGKFCYHYGRYTETICDRHVIDTILIK